MRKTSAFCHIVQVSAEQKCKLSGCLLVCLWIVVTARYTQDVPALVCFGFRGETSFTLVCLCVCLYYKLCVAQRWAELIN